MSEALRDSMQLLLKEWYGSGVYPAGGALDVMSMASGLRHSDPYAGTMTLPRSFKQPSDSPGLLMVSEKDATKVIKRALDKGIEMQKGYPEFLSAVYQVVNFVSSQKLAPQKIRLQGKNQLSFQLNFPNAQGLDRTFNIVLSKKGKGMVYDLKLSPIGVTPRNAPTVFFKKTYSDAK